jgi:hypothetical protein
MVPMLDFRSLRRVLLAHCAALGLAACADGTSHIEAAFAPVHPLDAAVAAAALVYLHPLDNADAGWRAASTDIGDGQYRISVTRAAWNGGGEGEFSRRFDSEAGRVAAARSCSGFTILSYQERYEAQLVGAMKVAEGLIECH